ncbi:MAG: lysophospholipid acyltransferase family protein [Actinomycetota bacterium]|nr:lysophospholipid acyltransferase family protein [Actinomycetota bacterium]
MALTPRGPSSEVDLSKPPASWELRLYGLARVSVVGVSRLLWDLRLTGLDNVPVDGPYVVAPVHRSYIDTLVVAGITRGRLRYMGKDALWRNSASGALLSALGGFPVHRGVADREALRRCEKVLASGEPVVLFPEGGRRTGPVVEHIHEGAPFVAARAGVPLLPVGIGGSEQAWAPGSKLPGRSRVWVVVGKPMTPPVASPGGRVPRSALRQFSADLQARLQELFDQAQQMSGDSMRRGRS